MKWILLFVGFIFIIMTFIKPKTEKEAKSLEPYFKHKWKFRIAGVILVLISIGLFVGTETKPKKSDAELFQEFYAEILQKTREFDNLLVPFKEALSKSDLIGAVQIAKNIEPEASQLWLKISSTKVPDFQNKKVKEQVEKGLEYLVSGYRYKKEILEKYIDIAKNPSQLIYKLAEIKDATDKADNLLILAVAEFETVRAQLEISNQTQKERK